MKKSILAILICFATFVTKAQTINFTVTSSSQSFSITCTSPSVVLNATTNYTGGAVAFYWGNATQTLTGNSVTLTTPGIYTVGALSIPNYATQTLTIFSNTVAPVTVVSPSTTAINCTAAASTVSLTAISPTLNYVSTIISPSGGSVTSNNQNVFYTPSAPGVYTTVVTNQTNGCISQNNFTVTSTASYPTFSLISSPPGFTLGCSSKSFCAVTFTNVQTNPPGSAVSFTFIAPGGNTVVNGPFGILPSTNANIPGNYTAIIYENSSGCKTSVPFTVLQNTVAPTLDSLIVPNQILDCNTPNTIIKAYSSNANIGYTWSLGTATATGSTFPCAANLSAPSLTAIGNVSCGIVDNNNLCKTTTVITLFQNIFKPNAVISVNGNTNRACLSSNLVLNNASSSNIPPNAIFSNTLPVVGFIWNGPSVASLSLSSTYTALVAGVYTLTAKDLNNGCTSNAIFNVDDCSGIGEISGQEKIQFYPNPAHDKLTIVRGTTTQQQIIISDIFGKKISEIQLNDSQSIDVSQLPQGIYFISVSQNSQIINTSRFIKE